MPTKRNSEKYCSSKKAIGFTFQLIRPTHIAHHPLFNTSRELFTLLKMVSKLNGPEDHSCGSIQ